MKYFMSFVLFVVGFFVLPIRGYIHQWGITSTTIHSITCATVCAIIASAIAWVFFTYKQKHQLTMIQSSTIMICGVIASAYAADTFDINGSITIFQLSTLICFMVGLGLSRFFSPIKEVENLCPAAASCVFLLLMAKIHLLDLPEYRFAIAYPVAIHFAFFIPLWMFKKPANPGVLMIVAAFSFVFLLLGTFVSDWGPITKVLSASIATTIFLFELTYYLNNRKASITTCSPSAA